MRYLTTYIIIGAILLLTFSCNSTEEQTTTPDDTLVEPSDTTDSTTSSYGISYNISNLSTTPFEVILDINIDIDEQAEDEWVIAYKLYNSTGASTFRDDAEYGNATYITQSGSYSLSPTLLSPETNYTLAAEAFKRIDYTYQDEETGEEIFQPYLLVGSIYTSSGTTQSATIAESVMTLTPTISTSTSSSFTLLFNNGFKDFIGCMVGYISNSELSSYYSGDIDTYIENCDIFNSDACSIADFRVEDSDGEQDVDTAPTYTIEGVDSRVGYTIFTIPITQSFTLGTVATISN